MSSGNKGLFDRWRMEVRAQNNFKVVVCHFSIKRILSFHLLYLFEESSIPFETIISVDLLVIHFIGQSLARRLGKHYLFQTTFERFSSNIHTAWMGRFFHFLFSQNPFRSVRFFLSQINGVTTLFLWWFSFNSFPLHPPVLKPHLDLSLRQV